VIVKIVKLMPKRGHFPECIFKVARSWLEALTDKGYEKRVLKMPGQNVLARQETSDIFARVWRRAPAGIPDLTGPKFILWIYLLRINLMEVLLSS
jgi:hypothetical protein